MVLPALGSVALAIASATPGGYLYCKAGGWGNRRCPGVINTYEAVAKHTMNIGYYLLTGDELDMRPEIWYDPPGYYGPPEKWQHDLRIRAYMDHIAWEARCWSYTKELMIPPAYELADWTKDLIVLPPPGPSELIVWTPPWNGLPWELAHVMFPPDDPPPVYDIVFDSTTVPQQEAPFRGHTTAPLTSALDTFVYDSTAASNGFGMLLSVIAFYTLVFGLIATDTLAVVEPASRAWWLSVFGDLGALGALGSIGRAINGFMVRLPQSLLSVSVLTLVSRSSSRRSRAST